jgi:tetratricopeptide (TPR) repeat protein
VIRALAILAAVAVGLAAAPAAAQPAPPPDVACKDRKEAKRLFDQGHLAYRRGDYEQAILRWQDSYALCQEPLIFFNIHNAYEKLGQLKEALENLKKWRENAPRREHQELDEKIQSLERRVRVVDEEEQRRRAEEERRNKEDEERRRAAEPRPPDAGTEPDGGMQPMQIAGFALVGVGGVAVIAGVVMDAVAASSRPDETEACTEDDGRLLCTDALRDDIETSNSLAIAGDVTWIVGAVLAATGAGLLIYVEVTGGDSEAAVTLGPGTVGVRTRF